MAKKSSFTTWGMVITLLVCMVSTFKTSAQHPTELTQALSQMPNEHASEAQSLYFDVQSTASLDHGNLSIAGDGSALVLDLSSDELSSLPVQSSQLQNVKLARIRLESSNSLTLDASSLSYMPSLAYVVVLISEEFSATQLADLQVNGLGQQVYLMYQVSIPN